MRLQLTAITALAFGSALAPPASANDVFNLQYRVERSDTSKLSLETCAQAVAKEAGAAGYTHSVDRHPGQLITITGGPRRGGSSLIVHCIAVGDKTVSVVQALDYRNDAKASGGFADKVQAAILQARGN